MDPTVTAAVINLATHPITLVFLPLAVLAVWKRPQFMIVTLQNLIFLPIILFVGFAAIFRVTKRDMGRKIGAKELKRFHLPSRQSCSEVEETEAVQAKAMGLLNAGDYDGLHALIADYDRTRGKTPFGHSKSGLIVDILMHPFTAVENAVEETGIEPAPAHIDSLVAAFDDRLARAPGNHIAAALAALAHMQAGWLYRGCDFADTVTEEGWRGMLRHFAAAARILAGFDAQANDSPLLAYAQYRLCNGSEDGAERIRAAFAIRTLLDSENPNVYIAHGFNLLPRWYGDYEELEAEARAAAELTRASMGSAGYALMYLEPLECDPEAAARVDPAAFADGLLDFARYKGTQYAANWSARKLLERVMNCRESEHRQAYEAALNELVREDLCCIVPYAWPEFSVAEVRHELARCWQDELAGGATIAIDANGAQIDWPDDSLPQPQPT